MFFPASGEQKGNQNILKYVGTYRERRIKMLENEQPTGSSLNVNNSKQIWKNSHQSENNIHMHREADTHPHSQTQVMEKRPNI